MYLQKGSSDSYGRRNQLSLFGALVHSHSSSLSPRLEIPALSDNADFNGIQVPKLAEVCIDHCMVSQFLNKTINISHYANG